MSHEQGLSRMKFQEYMNNKIDISRLDIRVGRIEEVVRHPNADNLYVYTVDVGEEARRCVVNGPADRFTFDELENRLAVFLCNLKPARFRGVTSQAMLIFATSQDKSKIEILDPPDGSMVGDRVTVYEYPGIPDVRLNPKKKIWEHLRRDMITDGETVATYKKERLVVDGKGYVKAQTVRYAQIS